MPHILHEHELRPTQIPTFAIQTKQHDVPTDPRPCCGDMRIPPLSDWAQFSFKPKFLGCCCSLCWQDITKECLKNLHSEASEDEARSPVIAVAMTISLTHYKSVPQCLLSEIDGKGLVVRDGARIIQAGFSLAPSERCCMMCINLCMKRELVSLVMAEQHPRRMRFEGPNGRKMESASRSTISTSLTRRLNIK